MSNIRIYCRHDVADYALWKKGYDGFANYRKTHGVIHESVYQSIDNPNDITVILDFNNINEAKAFAASEELKANMSKLGVKGTPQIWHTTESIK
ncbi:MAG: hypothetical protein RL610_1323 [Pseudomonadota bacterium]|jgi:hypothetical protein